MKSIETDSVIFDVSLGAPRTFLFRHVGQETAAGKVTLQHGSAIVLTTEANVLLQHAVLEEPGAGPRVSVVFRKISTIKSAAFVASKAAAAEKARVRRTATKLKRAQQ